LSQAPLAVVMWMVPLLWLTQAKKVAGCASALTASAVARITAVAIPAPTPALMM
jgi:hypothetical protein